MAAVTQHRPSDALAGRRYGSFAGKPAFSGSTHPVDVLTQHRPDAAIGGKRYGSFAGRSGSGAPTAPSSVTGTPTSGTTATIAWTDNSGDETGFDVEIAPVSTGTYAAASGATNPTAANVVSFAATGLTDNTEYTARVRAKGASGDSAYATSASFWTDNTGGGGGSLDPITGDLDATESGADVGAFVGAVPISGTLAASESGADVAAFNGVVETGEIFASLDATETGADVGEFIGGAVSLSGALAASESGSDTAAFVGEVVGAEPEIVPRTRRGHASHWVRARQRMALQTWIEYLTEEEPTEATQKVITEVKAGRPVPKTKDKGPANISAERLAEKIIPSRLWAAQNLIVDNVDVQRVVLNAIRIAQERDDEEVLMLL